MKKKVHSEYMLFIYVLDINPRKTNAKLILRKEMYRSQAKLSVKRSLLMLQQIPIFRAYDKSIRC